MQTKIATASTASATWLALLQIGSAIGASLG